MADIVVRINGFLIEYPEFIKHPQEVLGLCIFSVKERDFTDDPYERGLVEEILGSELIMPCTLITKFDTAKRVFNTLKKNDKVEILGVIAQELSKDGCKCRITSVFITKLNILSADGKTVSEIIEPFE